MEKAPHASERGSAMVMALGVLAVLAILAFVVMGVVVTEKKTAHSEYTNTRSFNTADAASEAGVNWILHQRTPPDLVDSLNNVFVSDSLTTLHGPSEYEFDVRFVRKKHRAGWTTDYKDYEFLIMASGVSAQQSQAAVDVGATRLYREGY
jgi:Tfp pilus assembly protein PilX